MEENELIIESSIIKNNIVEHAGNGYGGGLSIDKKPARITNTLIANNQLKNTNQFYYQTQGAGIHTEIIEVQYNTAGTSYPSMTVIKNL